MPLEILLPLVIAGIVGGVGLVWLLQPTPPLVFTAREQAAEIWNRRNPDAPARSVHLNPAGSHALVETATGPGILWSFGADPVNRLLTPDCDIRETNGGLRITTHDFTAPRIDIPLDSTERRHWLDLLKVNR